MPKRLLFMAQNITLAHISRVYALADTLEGMDYEIIVATDSRYDKLLPPRPWQRVPMHVMSLADFTDALQKGRPVVSKSSLLNDIEEDLALIRELKPDVVIGDIRLSLGVSARVAGIPYINISSAYWSAYADLKMTVPDIPLSHFFSPPIAQSLFSLAQPLAFAIHAKPHNDVRRLYHQPLLPADMRHAYTDGDMTLFTDSPALVPLKKKLPSQHYIGTINWSVASPMPPWFDELPADEPIILASIGSSGNKDLIPYLLEALAKRPEKACMLLSGYDSTQLPSNVFAAPFLPIEALFKKACLFISNGGNSSYQSLTNRVPVLGVASNLDQYLCMQGIVKAGGGALLRSYPLKAQQISSTIDKMLEEKNWSARLKPLQEQMQAINYREEFPRLLKAFLEQR